MTEPSDKGGSVWTCVEASGLWGPQHVRCLELILVDSVWSSREGSADLIAVCLLYPEVTHNTLLSAKEYLYVKVNCRNTAHNFDHPCSIDPSGRTLCAALGAIRGTAFPRTQSRIPCLPVVSGPFSAILIFFDQTDHQRLLSACSSPPLVMRSTAVPIQVPQRRAGMSPQHTMRHCFDPLGGHQLVTVAAEIIDMF